MKNKIKNVFSFSGVAVLAALLVNASASAATYVVDAAHSSVNFKVRHLVAKTTGKFDTFDGTIEYVPGKPDVWSVQATAEAASINTAEAKRDEHLRGEDFFNVKKFPKLTFKSKKVADFKNGKGKLIGDLTIHGVTKTVTFDLELGGEGVDPWGNTKVGFTAITKISRKEFGLTWNKTLETGSLLVGDDVEIALEIEANLKK